MESGGQSYPPQNTRWWREVELPCEHRDEPGSYPRTAVWDPGLDQRRSRSVVTLWHGHQDEEIMWEELIRDVDLQRTDSSHRPGLAEPNLRETGNTCPRIMNSEKSGQPGGSSKVTDEPPVFKVGFLDSPDTSQIFDQESWELINAALEKIHANDAAYGKNPAPQIHNYYPHKPEMIEHKMPESHEHKSRSSPKKNSSSKPESPVAHSSKQSPSPVAHSSTQSSEDEKSRRYIDRLEEAVRQNLASKKKEQLAGSHQALHLTPRHKDSAFELWKERVISFLKISDEARQKYEQIKRRRAGIPNDKQLLTYILDTMKNLGVLAMDIVRNAVLFCYLLGCMLARLALEAYRAPRFIQGLLALGLIIAVLGAIYVSSKQQEIMYNVYDFEI